MTWWLRPLQATVKGAAVTLSSTVISCALALQVEKSTHRLFFWMAPHWYAKVDRAYGLTEDQLHSVRQLTVSTTTTIPDDMMPVPVLEPVFSSDTVFTKEGAAPTKSPKRAAKTDFQPWLPILTLPQKVWADSEIAACALTG